ncbi:MAG TPA: single-stranded DNA-binding protein [Dehalococcoidia bacterium]|nr:single-stranded DNA-binding protein [Dehalococcoidia bacterium]
MNKLIVIGNLGRDPEMTYTPSGQAVTKFSIASNRKYNSATGEPREETEWFNCSAWGKLAETCNQYLTKGQQVYVEGRLHSRLYQTQGGETRNSLDVAVQDIQFLGQRAIGEGNGSAGGNPAGAAAAPGSYLPDDIDLPF